MERVNKSMAPLLYLLNTDWRKPLIVAVLVLLFYLADALGFVQAPAFYVVDFFGWLHVLVPYRAEIEILYMMTKTIGIALPSTIVVRRLYRQWRLARKVKAAGTDPTLKAALLKTQQLEEENAALKEKG